VRLLKNASCRRFRLSPRTGCRARPVKAGYPLPQLLGEEAFRSLRESRTGKSAARCCFSSKVKTLSRRPAIRSNVPRTSEGTPLYCHSCYRTCQGVCNRRVSNMMPVLLITVRIMRHVINRGEKYGRLAVIREVHKTGADGRRYRAALCRCDCGKHVTPRVSSLKSGDARSCGCSRGLPRYEQKRCPVCGTLAMIRRGRRSCSPGVRIPAGPGRPAGRGPVL
jgi:hypothetical protein